MSSSSPGRPAVQFAARSLSASVSPETSPKAKSLISPHASHGTTGRRRGGPKVDTAKSGFAASASLTSPSAASPNAPRRRQRTNSLERDLQDLSQLREEISAARSCLDQLMNEEKEARLAVEHEWAPTWRTLCKQLSAKLKYAEYHDDLQYRQRSQRALMARVGDLIRQSREQEEERRRVLRELRKAEVDADIAEYKRRVGNAKEKKRSRDARTRLRRSERIREERVSRALRLRGVREELEREKAQSAKGEKELEQKHRCALQAKEQQLIERRHEYVMQMRAASTSPTLFLQLPPIAVQLASSDNSDLERLLRRSAAGDKFRSPQRSASSSSLLLSTEPARSWKLRRGARRVHRVAPLAHGGAAHGCQASFAEAAVGTDESFFGPEEMPLLS